MTNNDKDLDKILISFKYFSSPENWLELAEKFFKIEDIIKHTSVPFKFTKIQKKTFNIIIKQLKTKEAVDCLIIKSRRAQQSSLIAFFSCCVALFYPNSENYIIAHQYSNAKTILKMYASLLDNDFVREYLSLIYNVPKDKVFSVAEESIKLCNKSKINIASMEGGTGKDNISIGAGASIRFLHITEYFGKYSSVQKTFDAIKGVNTWLVRETTPRPATAVHEDYERCISNPHSKTEIIFFPWWEDENNFLKPYVDYVPSKQVLTYAKEFNPNLTIEQLAFFDDKLSRSSLKSFNEEYPATPELAFCQSSSDLFFPQNVIQKCVIRYNTLLPYVMDYPIILGIDPAYTGKDYCAFCLRQGNLVLKLFTIKVNDDSSTPTSQICNETLKIVNDCEKIYKKSITKIFIDKTGSQSLIDVLKDILGKSFIVGVSFGESPFNKVHFLNKGAEMIASVKSAMEEDVNYLLIPDDKNLIKQLGSIKFLYNNKGQLQREGKEFLKERIGMSPDELDALALTYAYPIRYTEKNITNYFDNNNLYNSSNNKELGFLDYLK